MRSSERSTRAGGLRILLRLEDGDRRGEEPEVRHASPCEQLRFHSSAQRSESNVETGDVGVEIEVGRTYRAFHEHKRGRKDPQDSPSSDKLVLVNHDSRKQLDETMTISSALKLARNHSPP